MVFRMRNVILCVIIFLFASFSFAQEYNEEDPDWFWDKEIASVTFENLVNVKRTEVNGITSNYIGRNFTEEVYSEIIDRLYALDVFDEISPYARPAARDPNKIEIVFSVVEKPIISNIIFVGNRKVRNGELRETVKIKADDIFIESRVLLEERALRDMYLEKGYTGVRVSSSVEMTEKGVEITFVIDEGANTVISSIVFQGNTIVSARTLKSKISLKEAGLFRKGSFQRTSLEADRQAIVAYYQERGYVDARVVDVIEETELNVKKDRNELTLTFIIQEGPQYTLGNLTIQGNSIFDTERLRALIKVNEGAIFNMIKLQEGMQSIVDLYAENGYMTNQYFPNMVPDVDHRSIDYTLTIYETTRSHIENIVINGNTRTKDFVILRELGIKEGDAFSRERLMNGLRNLYNLRYFSNIVPEPTQGSEANLVDLIISVEEQSTTSLNFGLTFSGITDPEQFPLSIFAGWENGNLRGEGRTVSANLSLSTTIQSISGSYGQNWIKDSPISFNGSLSLSHSQDQSLYNYYDVSGALNSGNYYFKYDNWSATLNSTLGRRWLPNFAILTLTGGLTDTILSHQYNNLMFVPVDTSISRYTNSLGLINSVWGQISLDDRDLNYDPSKGWFFSQRLAWYGLIPVIEKEFFLRSDTKLEGYLTLFNIPFTEKWSFKMVLAAYTGFSFIVPVSRVTNSNKLYINGMFDGRGWTNIHNSTRSLAMISNRFELRVPIVPGVLGVDAWFDLVGLKPNAPLEEALNLRIEDFYWSLGPGLRFLLPQFPLHLLLANTFRFKDGGFNWEKTWQFVLSFNITNR